MRSLLAFALIGCSGGSSSPDAATNTGPFSPQLCTGGNPGDATCPINTIDLGVSGSKLTFAFQPDSGNPNVFYVSSPKLTAGSAGLYLSHPKFEAWPEGAGSPSSNPSDPNATTIVDLVGSEMTVLTPTMTSASRMTLAFDAIGPHR